MIPMILVNKNKLVSSNKNESLLFQARPCEFHFFKKYFQSLNINTKLQNEVNIDMNLHN